MGRGSGGCKSRGQRAEAEVSGIGIHGVRCIKNQKKVKEKICCIMTSQGV